MANSASTRPKNGHTTPTFLRSSFTLLPSMSLADALKKGRAFLTPRSSSESVPLANGFTSAPEGALFPKVDPAVDGEDCDHDCASCEIRLPKGWKIDENERLWGHLKAWSTHMLVATGKTDWKHDIEDEKGSIMEAIRDCDVKPNNGKLKLSASNMPLPHDNHSYAIPDRPTTVLLLPAFTFIDNVTPATVPHLINHYISPAPTTTTPLNHKDLTAHVNGPSNGLTKIIDAPQDILEDAVPVSPRPPALIPPESQFTTRACLHRYIILLCSHRARDARCGQSAPLLRKEFERHLRKQGLFRDLHDERPGGVGIYFVSHVGGHKFSANVMIYRREEGADEANQCIWLGRVRPEDCEGIIKFTVLQGKVIHPERQLRAGFDRKKGLVSW